MADDPTDYYANLRPIPGVNLNAAALERVLQSMSRFKNAGPSKLDARELPAVKEQK